MFKKGELVIYGTNGVCEVKDITTLELKGVPKGRLYYVLQPYKRTDGTIFTPVDNEKVPIRRIMSTEEARQFLEEIPNIEELTVENDRVREESYKICIRSCVCREWVRIIKALHSRKEEREKRGKKITATDEKYLKQAEECLFSELSIPLGVEKDNVEEYIINHIEKKSI